MASVLTFKCNKTVKNSVKCCLGYDLLCICPLTVTSSPPIDEFCPRAQGSIHKRSQKDNKSKKLWMTR
ncbi:hypothetical protein STEG23_027209, partial [Scotinomys teguina]